MTKLTIEQIVAKYARTDFEAEFLQAIADYYNAKFLRALGEMELPKYMDNIGRCILHIEDDYDPCEIRDEVRQEAKLRWESE